MLGIVGLMLGAFIVVSSGSVDPDAIRPLFVIALGTTIATFILVWTQLSARRWGLRGPGRSFFGDLHEVMRGGRYLKRWLVIAAVGQLPLGMVMAFSAVYAHEVKGDDALVLGLEEPRDAGVMPAFGRGVVQDVPGDGELLPPCHDAGSDAGDRHPRSTSEPIGDLALRRDGDTDTQPARQGATSVGRRRATPAPLAWPVFLVPVFLVPVFLAAHPRRPGRVAAVEIADILPSGLAEERRRGVAAQADRAVHDERPGRDLVEPVAQLIDRDRGSSPGWRHAHARPVERTSTRAAGATTVLQLVPLDGLG